MKIFSVIYDQGFLLMLGFLVAFVNLATVNWVWKCFYKVKLFDDARFLCCCCEFDDNWM